MCIKSVSEILKKLTQSVKDQYSKCAEELKKERAEHRDLYEISYGFKTRKPRRAYKFFMMEAAKEGKLGKNPFEEGPKAWKKLPDEEKEKYQRMAQNEKLIYLFLKREYELQVKNSFTRPKTGFHFFMEENRDSIEKWSLGFVKYCYQKWRRMNEKEKTKYFSLAELHYLFCKEIKKT
jgi:hypothetical protein